jgi:hypothetical protein
VRADDLGPEFDDDPATLTLAVGRLVAAVNRVLLVDAEDGEPGDRAATLAALQGRSTALLDRVDGIRPGDGGLSVLRRRLQALQRRLSVLQLLGNCLEEKWGVGRAGRAYLTA